MQLQKTFARLLDGERERFPLWMPVFLALGIGAYFALPFEPPLWWALSATLSAWVIVLALPRWRLRVLVVALMVTGMAAAGLRTRMVEAPQLYSELFYRQVEGRIVDIQTRQKGTRVTLDEVFIERVQPRTTPQRINLTLRKMPEDLEVGDRISAKASLFPPPTPPMPDAYDFARGFYFDRIGGVGYAPGEPEIIAKGNPSGLEQWLNALRLSLNQRIVEPMSPENGPVAAAMMVGEMSAVTPEVSDAMRDAGIYHALSISGLHMSLVVALLYVSVRFLLSLYPPVALRLPVKKIAAMLGLLGALAYLLVAGYPVPAVRSFIMVACVMLAVLCDRRGISLYSLAWAAMLILLLQPESLLGASFQLSFAATLAILALYEIYAPLLRRPAGIPGRIGMYFSALMVTSLAASLATTPLVIYHFNRFALWGILANMLLIPLASFWIMPAAVLAFLLMPFGLAQYPLGLLDTGIGLLIAGSRFFAGLPLAAVALPSLTFGGLMLCVAGGIWLCLIHGKWRLAGFSLVLIGMASIALHKPYDVLVSDEGNVALRMDDGRYLFVRGKPTSFTAQSWLRTDGREGGLTLSEGIKQGLIICEEMVCRASLHGWKLAVARRDMQDDAQEAALCEAADIAIYADTLHGNGCAAVPLLVDRRSLQVSGSLGLRLSRDSLTVDGAVSRRGTRPWVARAPRRR